MFDFTGKTVLVTGGAQGIGKEVVRGVVNGGGHAVILDLNEEKAKAKAKKKSKLEKAKPEKAHASK